MGMHPKNEVDGYGVLWDVLFGPDRAAALAQMSERGLLSPAQLPHWQQFLAPVAPGSRVWANAIDHFHFKTCAQLESNSYLSTQTPQDIVANLRGAAAAFGQELKHVDQLRGKVFLDYGSGVYRPFNASIILYCNGVDRVYAYEPFALRTEFVLHSFHRLIERMSNRPEDYIFSGISTEEFIGRLKTFVVPGLEAKLQRLNDTPGSQLRLGGLTFFRDLAQIPANSVDCHFSNAVLEHVDDIEKYMGQLLQIAAPDSIGLHVVDFLDHRYYDDPTLSPVEKYFDGVLDEINGLTPTELEQRIIACGWTLQKVQATRIPEKYVLEDKRPRTERYARHGLDELTQHVNFYKMTRHA